MIRDLAELFHHPRRWWWNATHAPCPVCRGGAHQAEPARTIANLSGRTDMIWRPYVAAGRHQLRLGIWRQRSDRISPEYRFIALEWSW